MRIIGDITMAKYKISSTGVWDSEHGIWFDPVHAELWAEYQQWLAIPGNTPDPAFSRDDLYGQRYSEVTDRTSALIDAPGYVFRSVPFHTDIVAQMNFSGLFAVRSGLQYPYEVWDGRGSVSLADEQDLTQFCMGVMAHIESVRRTGKVVRDSLENMSYEELLNFVDPRG